MQTSQELLTSAGSSQEFPFQVDVTAGDVVKGLGEIAWDNRGRLVGLVAGAGLALAQGNAVLAQGGGPENPESVTGPLGQAGIWLGKVVERAAKNPLEVIVPMFGVGLTYGAAQGAWRTFRREAPVEPEQSSTFRQLLKVATQNGMELDDPRQQKAFANTLASFRIIPAGGEQAPFLEDLWEEVKTVSPKEASEWTGAGVWLYVTLNLMESASRMPADSSGKYAQYLVMAIAAGFTLQELKKAILPAKR